MAAGRAIVAFVALIIIVVVLWYFVYGFSRYSSSTTSTTTLSSTNSTNSISNVPTTTSILYSGNCAAVSMISSQPGSVQSIQCKWAGGPLGLWVESGNSTSVHFSIKGMTDNFTYINKTSNYQCLTFYQNFTAPAQTYLVNVKLGSGVAVQNTSCIYGGIILNQTLHPPKKVYNYIYNGNFSNGQYTGWNITGKGFGTVPLNLSYANSNAVSPCYFGTKWQNYGVSPYVATTYTCGTQVSAGNLTSSAFIASKSFLNFKIISQQDNFLYVEILYNGTPYIIAHYDTFNTSLGTNASKFFNASIPLVTVLNKPVQIKIVADTPIAQHFMAIGDFVLSNQPNQDEGIQSQPYNFTH